MRALQTWAVAVWRWVCTPVVMTADDEAWAEEHWQIP
jgi:hypothetical protein